VCPQWTSHHGADGVEVGVEADHLPLGRLGVGVQRVLEGGLAVVVLVDGASRVLSFVRFPGEEEREEEVRDRITVTSPSPEAAC